MAAYLLCVGAARVRLVAIRGVHCLDREGPEANRRGAITGAAEQAFSEGFARAPAHDYKIAAARYLSGVAGAIRLPGRFASVTEAPNRPLKPPAIGSTLGRQT